MITYKTLKGTRRSLYLKGLKAKYFYFLCFGGGIGAVFIVLSGFNNGILLHLLYAGIFIVALYGFLFWLSLETPYKNIKKRYTSIRNIDLLKILMK